MKVLSLLLTVFIPAALWARTTVKREDGGWVVENRLISAKFFPSTGAIELVDKRTGLIWRHGLREVERVVLPKGQRLAKPILLTSKMVADARNIRDEADLSARVWAWWDEKRLFPEVEVWDERFDVYSIRARNEWKRDSLEFWLGLLQIGVSLSKEEGARAGKVKKWLEDVSASFELRDDGYIGLWCINHPV